MKVLIRKSKLTGRTLILAVLILAVFSVTVSAGAGSLQFQQTLDRNSVRLMLGFDLARKYNSDALPVIRDTSQYDIFLQGGYARFVQSDQVRPVKVDLSVNSVDGNRVITGLVFTIDPLLTVEDSMTVRVILSDTVAHLLNLTDHEFGPAKASVDGVKGVGLFTRFFNADIDLSRLEQGDDDGAIKYDVILSSYISEALHIDLSADGMTFIGGGSGSTDSAATARPGGQTNFGLTCGYLLAPVHYFGALDVTGTVAFENAGEGKARNVTAGLRATIFPRLDRVVSVIASARNARTINFPPRLMVAIDYVNETHDSGGLLTGDRWRLGAEADWRLEFDEAFFVKLEWKYAHFGETPLADRSERDFSYLDLTGNYRLREDLSLFVRYTDGELAPIYEKDNTVTTGFRYEFTKRD